MPLINLFWAGGPVMWPLLFFMIATVAIVVERLIFWVKILRGQTKVIRDTLTLCRSDRALGVEKLSRHLDLPIARILHEALNLDGASPDELALAIDGAIQAELPIIKRFTDFLDLIVGLSPLLGLLGTVTGLMTSFASLTLGNADSSQTANVTGGISEALITTATGLIVAILAFVFASLFRSFCTRQIGLIQEKTAEVELLCRRQSQAGGQYASSSR